MVIDALILAGGRSSRLEGSAKQNLRIAGVSLLQGTVDAVRAVGARHVVVVGDEAAEGAVTLREEPAFGGPVAAIAAGLRALTGGADAVIVLACDMPRIPSALPNLLASFSGDGVIAVDRGRRQQLAVVAAPGSLSRAVAALPRVDDAAMRMLLAELDLTDVAVPDGATDDIDTWEDAERFGIPRPDTVGSTT
jgi:molybdopterin-guanine dinucleotide biosynthesis protein A